MNTQQNWFSESTFSPSLLFLFHLCPRLQTLQKYHSGTFNTKARIHNSHFCSSYVFYFCIHSWVLVGREDILRVSGISMLQKGQGLRCWCWMWSGYCRRCLEAVSCNAACVASNTGPHVGTLFGNGSSDGWACYKPNKNKQDKCKPRHYNDKFFRGKA